MKQGRLTGPDEFAQRSLGKWPVFLERYDDTPVCPT